MGTQHSARSSTEISSSWREQTTRAGRLLHPSTVLLSCSPCTPLRNGDPASMPAASQHRQRHHSSIKAESCRIPPDPPPAHGALLGHMGLEHSRASAWAPRHSAQPWAETLHLRVRCWVPLAQVTEQRLQAPHSNHCPSTVGTK